MSGALFRGVAHANREPEQAQQARWVVVEAVGADRAQFVSLDIGQPVHRIQQQAARGAVERERDGIAGEVAPAQIVLNGGRGNRRLAAAARILLLARHGNLRGHSAGKHQFRGLPVLVGGHGLRPGPVANGLRHLQGLTLDDEVEIPYREAGEHIAHRAPGQKHIDVGRTGRRLHLFNHPVLVRAEVALQHVHVVAHRLRTSGSAKFSRPRQSSR